MREFFILIKQNRIFCKKSKKNKIEIHLIEKHVKAIIIITACASKRNLVRDLIFLFRQWVPDSNKKLIRPKIRCILKFFGRLIAVIR